ncbi:MAG: LPS export ABC transporter periplasmic protein LptC [Magnetococcales bacterium]|nr:LPS export ABC transporter periplasmic protein LptC [Magnetococcales bacterium]
MKLRWKHLFLLLPVLAVGGVLWALRSPKAILLNLPTGLTATGIQFTHHGEDGQPLWSLSAPTVERSGEGVTTVHQPALTVHREHGSMVRITAQRGELAEPVQEVRLVGGVVVEDGPQRRLSGEELRVDPQQRILSSPAPFLLTWDGWRLEAERMRLDHDGRTLWAEGRVRVASPEIFGDNDP